MSQNKKPSWKERISNWTTADYMIASIIITSVNIGIVAFQVLLLIQIIGGKAL